MKTLQMGDGSTLIADVTKDEDGYVGVAFWKHKGNGICGTSDKKFDGMPISEIDCDLLLQFNNPISIDVLIQELTEAKNHL